MVIMRRKILGHEIYKRKLEKERINGDQTKDTGKITV